ncbi:dinitrogenase iron-molybdenum cofactor biosynthesis protein [Prolixibacteraceae bacterium JC049]|nr:dinitrogenase iron-molybdenum cofactor biosynthesis protein [Prolixibacteraceae bacterium JC049]
MKVLITSTGNTANANFDLRFGRAGWYCIYDTEDASTSFIENENKDRQGGAGTKAAEQVAALGVKKVISGDFGPKAKDLLNQFSIQMVILQKQDTTVQDVIDQLKK